MLFLNICRRQLSALQTMEIPLDGAKYDWLLNVQTLWSPWSVACIKTTYCCHSTDILPILRRLAPERQLSTKMLKPYSCLLVFWLSKLLYLMTVMSQTVLSARKFVKIEDTQLMSTKRFTESIQIDPEITPAISLKGWLVSCYLWKSM